MARDDPSPKIGAGHADAMWRQGLSELRGAFFNEGNVAQPPQYGLYGTRTPGEVAGDKLRDAVESNEARELNEEPTSILGERMDKAADMARDHRGRDSKDMERG